MTEFASENDEEEFVVTVTVEGAPAAAADSAPATHDTGGRLSHLTLFRALRKLRSGTGTSQTKLKGEVEKKLSPKVLEKLKARDVSHSFSGGTENMHAVLRADTHVSRLCGCVGAMLSMRAWHPAAPPLRFRADLQGHIMLFLSQMVMGDMIPYYQQQHLNQSSSTGSLGGLERQAGAVPQAAA